MEQTRETFRSECDTVILPLPTQRWREQNNISWEEKITSHCSAITLQSTGRIKNLHERVKRIRPPQTHGSRSPWVRCSSHRLIHFFVSFSVSSLFFHRRQYSGSVTRSGSNVANNYMGAPIIASRQPRLVIYATATNILICPDAMQSVRNFAVDTKETCSTPQHTTLCDIPEEGGIHQKLWQNLCLHTEQLFKCSRVNHTTHSETVSMKLTTKDAGIM